MDPAKILQIITNSTWMVTRLVGSDPVEFEKQKYLVEVPENSAKVPLLRLTVKINSPGKAVKFRIKSGNEGGYFSLEDTSGRLSLARPLDYETQTQHALVVEARAGSGRSQAAVVVAVKDVNDHAPAFPRSSLLMQLTEGDGRHLPKTILKTTATDGDKGKFGHLSYSLSGDGVHYPPSSPSSFYSSSSSSSATYYAPSSPSTASSSSSPASFAIDPSTGDVLLLRPLDRDPPHGRAVWRLWVTATDGELQASMSITINLKDVNDNAPHFPENHVTVAIPEDAPQGTSVVQVSAVDLDDPLEGHNARLTYSLERNVVEAASGSPIFTVDQQQGLVTTAICCLDREKTQKYILHVVATDGGGLKGTSTVEVEVSDVNDEAPRFSVAEWFLDVREGHPPGQVLASLTVIDPDTCNDFAFRLVPGSGHGWQLFRVEARDVTAEKSKVKKESPDEALEALPGPKNGVGTINLGEFTGSVREEKEREEAGKGSARVELRAVKELDYENPDHRKGFRFRLQVTDKGAAGWRERRRVGSAWVNINLIDNNDNTPKLLNEHAHRTIPEDAPAGTLLATFTATDADGAGLGVIHFSIAPESDPYNLFGVDGTGAVRVVGALDREKTPAHTILVWAADDGMPPRTATATLTVTVTDVNDNPPFLSEPKGGVEVEENGEPKMVTNITLGDPDDWRLGHGPPFSLVLDPRAPQHVSSVVRVDFDPKGEDGRGIGVVWVRGPLDREERRALLVPVVVGDAAPEPCTATLTLTLNVVDQNDNLLTPAAKTVTAHVLKEGEGSEMVPLGRIFVKDPDEGAEERTYAWRSPPPLPGFSLHPATGHLDMSPAVPPGRYHLQFEVNAPSQGQFGVAANVSVQVDHVTSEDLINAVPLTVPVPTTHVAGTPVLHRLVEAAQTFLSITQGRVKAVTIQAGNKGAHPSPITHVWLVGHDAAALHHALLHRREELSHILGVDIVEVGVGECGQEGDDPDPHHESCRAERVSGYTVVDADSTAVVGPKMRFGCGCGCGRGSGCEQCAQTPAPPTHTCTPRSCLNGGRCFPTSHGVRCVCPLPTAAPTCKVLMRHFQGDESIGSWAWVASIPPCPEVHISLEVLTTSQNATLLYSGPDHLGLADPPPPESASREVLLLELRNGRPFLMLNLGGGPVTLALTASYSLADSIWHRLDVIWKDELVEMVVDLCSGGSIDGPSTKATNDPSSRPPPPVPPDAHTCRGAARLPSAARTLNYQRPLQVGGMAHPAPSHTTYGWPEPIKSHPLKGCVRNLRVNGELRDLGAGVLSSGSVPGCSAADCPVGSLYCGLHGRCQVEAGATRCECESGWTGPDCSTPTTASTFHLHSFVRLALSFSPLGYTTSISLRFRTRRPDGDLVVLSSEGGGDRFALQLVGGRACVLLQLHPAPPRTLCLARVQLTDGRWHRLHAARYGSATFLTADDGDGDLYNASVSLEGRQLLEVDREARVVLGGAPHRGGDSGASTSQRDFHEGCLEDVRISNRPVPLPPALNRTAWGRVDEARGVGTGCEAPPACGNVTCRSPLTCVDTWRSYHCGCGEGKVMEKDSNMCHTLDQCAWSPCLHGGTCLPSHTGFTCSCLSGYGGRHCQLQGPGAASLRLSLAGLLAVLVWCTLLLLLVCAVLLHQHHRRSALRRGAADGKESTTPAETKGHVSPTPSDGHPPYLLELRLLAAPRVNRQSSWSTNPNIADVDVLQVDAASVTSSVEERHQQQENHTQGSHSNPVEEEGEGATAKQEIERSGCDDLRNYAYEGGGSSPGSLSSCLESCSGNAKFLGGFREVAHMLES